MCEHLPTLQAPHVDQEDTKTIPRTVKDTEIDLKIESRTVSARRKGKEIERESIKQIGTQQNIEIDRGPGEVLNEIKHQKQWNKCLLHSWTEDLHLHILHKLAKTMSIKPIK